MFGMKIDVRSSDSLYIECGDYTYCMDFSIEGEASLLRFHKDDEEDLMVPRITWSEGSDDMNISMTTYRMFDESVRESDN